MTLLFHFETLKSVSINSINVSNVRVYIKKSINNIIWQVNRLYNIEYTSNKVYSPSLIWQHIDQYYSFRHSKLTSFLQRFVHRQSSPLLGKLASALKVLNNTNRGLIARSKSWTFFASELYEFFISEISITLHLSIF